MGRRGHDEGSIYQRESDGKWVAAVNLGYGPDGKRKRKIFYGKTRKEVAAKLKVALRDQQQGLPIATERQTVRQFLSDWLEQAARPALRASTFATYESHIRGHILPALGHIKLHQLGAQQVQSLINQKLAAGLSTRTVADIHAVLRHALNQAVKWDLVPRNVAALVDRPRVERKEMHYLTPEQGRKLLEAVAGDRLEALYTVTIGLGLRRGEVLGLRWDDVDLDKGVLNVRGALQRVGGKLCQVEVKTSKSRRSINLPKFVIAALRTHRVRQLEERMLAGSKWQDLGYVFTTKLGTPIDPRNFKRSLDKVLEQAGLEHVHIHGLRHTAASLMIAQKIEPKMISETLGHSRISTTYDIYGHLFEPMRQEAADKMDEILGKKTG